MVKAAKRKLEPSTSKSAWHNQVKEADDDQIFNACISEDIESSGSENESIDGDDHVEDSDEEELNASSDEDLKGEEDFDVTSVEEEEEDLGSCDSSENEENLSNEEFSESENEENSDKEEFLESENEGSDLSPTEDEEFSTNHESLNNSKLENVDKTENSLFNGNKENAASKTEPKVVELKFKGKVVKKSNNKVDKPVIDDNDEYAEDSSDEEDIRNTVGNIPMNWYDEYKHLGYDWDGKQIIKPNQGDQLDEFLKRMEDPDFWKTVKDPQTGQDVVLSDQDINLIKRIQSQKIPDETFDEYAPWIEWFTSEVMTMPLRKFPEHKRSFLPSKIEARKVSKLVHALKMGWIKTRAEQDKLRAQKEPQFYMLWSTDDQAEEMRRIHKHIPAPKRHLPGHAESYNPPAEYLLDAKEMKQWEKLEETPWKRKLHFLPQKYDSLRKVPSYSRYIRERFLRCLDLYLCPRAVKMRLTIEPEALVPKLPSPKDLQPFPTVLSISYEGHTDMVRSISTDKTGQYLVSGSDDCTVKIWEVNTGRCIKSIPVEGTVRSVEWCPNLAISLILVASNNRVLLINPNVGDFLVTEKTDEILKEAPQSEVAIPDAVKTTVQWKEPSEKEYELGYRFILNHFKEVTQVTWHGKGDYFATVMPEGSNRSVIISQLSKRRSQLPFTKAKGLVQCVLFHPTRPMLFVATQRHVRVYDLLKQMMVKKLFTSSQWISKMAVHSGGDNLIVGTYDKKIHWFDLDLSTKPYQTLRLHGTAIRGIAFHKRYPLFASGSDDRCLIISHGMVYNDLLQNALIVPLKKLHDHEARKDFGILDVKFHPIQPWVFSAGADGTIKLYCN